MSLLFRKKCKSEIFVKESTPMQQDGSEQKSFNLAPSTSSTLSTDWEKSLASGSAEDLTNFLKNDFIYRVLDWTEESEYTGGYHRKYWTHQYALVRANAEALLYEHIDVLYKLLLAVKAKNDEQLNLAFVEGFREPPCFNNMTKTCTNEQLKSELDKALEHLQLVNSSQRLTELSNTLSNCKTEFDILASRIEILYETDLLYKQYAHDRNIKKILVNLSMLVLGFIPNVTTIK